MFVLEFLLFVLTGTRNNVIGFTCDELNFNQHNYKWLLQNVSVYFVAQAVRVRKHLNSKSLLEVLLTVLPGQRDNWPGIVQ